MHVGCSPPLISVWPLAVKVPETFLKEYILPSVAVPSMTAPASVTSVNVSPVGKVIIAEPTVVLPSYWCIALPIVTMNCPLTAKILSYIAADTFCVDEPGVPLALGSTSISPAEPLLAVIYKSEPLAASPLMW